MGWPPESPGPMDPGQGSAQKKAGAGMARAEGTGGRGPEAKLRGGSWELRTHPEDECAAEDGGACSGAPGSQVGSRGLSLSRQGEGRAETGD